jgi:hypothetical protein
MHFFEKSLGSFKPCPGRLPLRGGLELVVVCLELFLRAPEGKLELLEFDVDVELRRRLRALAVVCILLEPVILGMHGIVKDRAGSAIALQGLADHRDEPLFPGEAASATNRCEIVLAGREGTGLLELARDRVPEKVGFLELVTLRNARVGVQKELGVLDGLGHGNSPCV